MNRALPSELPATLESLVRPDRTAVIVYDMQIGVLRQMSVGARITEQVEKVLAAAREGGYAVLFTRHMSLPTRLTGFFGTRMAMAWQRTEDPEAISPWFARDCEAHAIAQELSPREDEAVFDKLAMSAFEGTPIGFVLRDLGLVSFILVGCATEIGLEPTVRHGADLGLVPIVVEDACGAGDAAAGERAIASMRFMGDALFANVDELCDLMRR